MDGSADPSIIQIFHYILRFYISKLYTLLLDSPFLSSFLFISFFPFLLSLPITINFHFFLKEQKKGKEEAKEMEKNE